ncbi:MAG: zinc-binding dehydrogenase [Candidatus Hodarchaeota archaeon]
MRRLYIPSVKKVVIEDVPDWEPGENEVQVNISYCGICGSDVHAYKGLHPFVPVPAWPGHEGSGIVSKLGPGAEKSGLAVGDKVTFEPNLVCGECYNCKVGRYNICEKLKVMGCQTKGMLADYFVAPMEKIVKIPNDMSLKDAAMTEPLSVGLHAVRRAGVKVGDHVVIIGAGTIGLSVLQFVKLAGATTILAVDLIEDRLDVARKLGATHVANASILSASEYLEKNPDLMGYEGVDIVFECVGNEPAMNECIKIARKGGKIIVMGVFGKLVNDFNAAWVQDREFNIIGSLMYTMRDVKDTIDAIYKGRVNVEPMITSVLDLDEGAKAFELADKDTKNQLKVMVKVKGD